MTRDAPPFPCRSSPIDSAPALAAPQDALLSAAQAMRCGFSREDVRRLCRRGEWLRLYRSVYLTVADALPELTRRQMIRAALLKYPEGIAVRESAAELLGLWGLPPREGADIHLALPAGTVLAAAERAHRSALGGPTARTPATVGPDLPAIHLHQYQVDPSHVITRQGMRLSAPVRTLADCFLHLPRLHAISVGDSIVNHGLLEQAAVADAQQLCAGRPGVEMCRPWFDLVDGRAESPLETRGRIACADEGVPPDTLQYPVHDRYGVLIARGDLGWFRKGKCREPQSILLGEGDGAGPHSTPQALLYDRQRQNRILALGYGLIRYTWADAARPVVLAGIVRASLHAG